MATINDRLSTNSIRDNSEKSNTKNLVLDRDYIQAAQNGDEAKEAVKLNNRFYPLYLNVGKAKNDNLYHFYDITTKLRDTAIRLNGHERLSEYLSAYGISTDSISNSSEKSNSINLVSTATICKLPGTVTKKRRRSMWSRQRRSGGAFSDGKPAPIKFYHGTKSFGFTEFDLRKMDDGRSIFLTSDLETAQSYSGSFDKRKIKETFGHLSLDDTVKKLNHIYKDVYAFKIAGSGMQVEINESGIDETFSVFNFKQKSNSIKLLKLATIREIPNAIKNVTLTIDDAENYHNKKSDARYAYIEHEVKILGVPCKLKIAIRKSLKKNKFWVHQIYVDEIKKSHF